MEELVSKNKISAQTEAKDWQDAIYQAGTLLIESGDIEKEYIDHMIDSVNELGPYMVIAKGFAFRDQNTDSIDGEPPLIEEEERVAQGHTVQ